MPGIDPPTAYDQRLRYQPKVSLVKVDLLKAGTPGVAFTMEHPSNPGEWIAPMFFPTQYRFPDRRVTTYHLSTLGVRVPDDLMFPPHASAPRETTLYHERVEEYVDGLRRELRHGLKL